jgi:trans-aconitate methyltransferase
MAENRWDALGYATHARFVSELGMPVVEWLAPQPDERVLDLGCGDGALTAKLAALGVRVTGMDHSQSMVDAASALGLAAKQGDMHAFSLGTRFDAVFTNAVLHWTRDIDAVVSCVTHHLTPGGRFVGEFGGFGNVAAIVVAIQSAMQLEGEDESAFAWYFPTPAEFGDVLARHGFEVKRVELIPRPTPLPTGMRNWLETFARPFVAHLPEAKQAEILDRAVRLLAKALQDQKGNWTADYVRLRFHAVLRPGAQD